MGRGQHEGEVDIGQVLEGLPGHQHDRQETRVSLNQKNMEAESYRAVTYHHHSNKMNMILLLLVCSVHKSKVQTTRREGPLTKITP